MTRTHARWITDPRPAGAAGLRIDLPRQSSFPASGRRAGMGHPAGIPR